MAGESDRGEREQLHHDEMAAMDRLSLLEQRFATRMAMSATGRSRWVSRAERSLGTAGRQEESRGTLTLHQLSSDK